MRIIGAFLAAATALTATAAVAVPVRANYGDILAGTSEDFESYAPGSGGGFTPLAFEGFTFQSNSLHVPFVSDEPPCDGQCLRLVNPPFDSDIIVGGVFSAFRPGTQSFGVRLPGTFVSLFVTVEGVGGTTPFLLLPSEGSLGPMALGFHDPAGLLSVWISDVEHFDDVVTSELAPIPLPPAGVALMLALGGLVLLQRRTTRDSIPD